MTVDRVLLVEDDAPVRAALAQAVELAGWTPVPAASYIEAKDHVAEGFPGVVLTDVRMPGKDGFALLDFVRDVDPDLPVILLTGEGDVPMAVRAVGRGAFDFLEKPCDPARLTETLRAALADRAETLGARAARRSAEAGDAAARLLQGTSPASEALRAAARRAAPGSAEVLVEGPPGSGTSKIAEVVHLLSPRARSPFVKRAAAGMDPAAVAAALEEAGRGTLFLDEIAALPPDAQFALAEALDAAPARLIAGTYRDLAEAAEGGAMHADLFYRFSLRIRVPPLAERPEDIPVLFRHYVRLAAEQSGLDAPPIPEGHLARLAAREWPGNARALMSHAMRFVLGAEAPQEGPPGLTERMARYERGLLAEALRGSGGNATRAAEMLRVPRKTLYDKLAKHGLRPESFR
ncbi:MAG: sigma-54-dependent transcriptional regulator [Hasllibacter sp.]